jgi:hypothetical protein
MAKEQKLFLKKVREAWAVEFPLLKPVDVDEVPKRPKGGNFRCDEYFGTRGVCYFVSFDFSDRRHGEFMVGITVSASPEKSVLNPSEYYPPSPGNVGSYNLAEFLNRQSFHWDLLDVDGKMNAILVSLGGEPIPTPDYVAVNIWKPSSYSLPFEQIADEAIRDVSDKLRRFVFPKLEITVEPESGGVSRKRYECRRSHSGDTG